MRLLTSKYLESIGNYLESHKLWIIYPFNNSVLHDELLRTFYGSETYNKSKSPAILVTQEVLLVRHLLLLATLSASSGKTNLLGKRLWQVCEKYSAQWNLLSHCRVLQILD